MSKRTLVDTNLIIRHLVQDDDEQAKNAAKLFDAGDRGEIVIVLLPAILAECVFVLESFYERERGEIASTLSALISSPGIEIAHVEIHVDALVRYRNTRLHFVDCILAATAVSESLPVATFDRGLRKLKDVRVDL